MKYIMTIVLLLVAPRAFAQSCESQLDALATTVAQQNQAIIAVTMRAAKTEQVLKALKADYLPLESASWPVERRGREQMEKILSSVEKAHGITPVPLP